jgi:ParB-like chromosome segregation protein Spo0J
MTARKALSIKYFQITALQLRPENPRIHAKKQISQLARSIKSFDFYLPILVDAQLQVIASHGRVVVCRPLGIASKQMIHHDHLSAHQLRAFVIGHHGVTENAESDNSLLGERLQNLSETKLVRSEVESIDAGSRLAQPARY